MTKKLTTEEFIKRSKDIHGDLYDYSLTDYKGANIKLTIIRRSDGKIYDQFPHNHFRGHSSINYLPKTKEELIEESAKIHGSKYDYSLVVIYGPRVKVKIICPIHGEFKQSIDSHIRTKCGCPLCGDLLKGATRRLTTEEFVERAKKTHDNLYDYSLVDYINSNTKVKIICPIHGEFKQNPSLHLYGCGCKNCANDGLLGLYSLDFFDTNHELKSEIILIYLVKMCNENEDFYKIGLTKNTLSERFSSKKTYNHKEIFSKRVNFYQGFLLEQSIIQSPQYPSYLPKHKFGGYNECLKLNKSQTMDIIEQIDRLQ
jgi:hypothetical protein